MKIQKTKLGFTLIELMVVITIIGILATGAVSVYTSQIQKARDSNRITSIKAIQGALEQAYSDASIYPSPAQEAVVASDLNCSGATPPIKCLVHLGYMPSLPKDVKSGQSGAGAGLDFVYTAVTVDSVLLQGFEVSVGFEAKASVSSKAGKDNGSDGNRFEVGNSLTADTELTGKATPLTCLYVATAGGAGALASPKIVIKGD